MQTIETVTRYRVHGHDFHRQADAQEYADSLAAVAEANAMWEGGATFGQVCARWPASEHGHQWGLGEPPSAIAPLTAGHRVIISHWQCSDKPAYRLLEFRVSDGRARWRLYVGGSGGWSGFYGNEVRVPDLARYAERGIHLEAEQLAAKASAAS